MKHARWSTRAELTMFSVLACAISWLIWLPLVLRSRGIDAPILPGHHTLGAVGPFAAALIVTWLGDGVIGLRALLARLVQWRIGWLWFTVSLFGPWVLLLVAWLDVGLFTGSWPRIGGPETGVGLSAPGLIGTWIVQTLTFGVGEETGWRGFALPRLQLQRSALAATLWLTLIWATWHIPAFLYRPTYSAMNIPMLFGWLFSLATGAVLLTWIFNSTRGSILAVSLFHGSVDAVFISDTTGALSSVTGALMLGAAVVVVVVARTKTLSGSTGKALLRAENTTPRPSPDDSPTPIGFL